MHGLLLRKTLLFAILWGGVFSVFPQTQAISCCWPWCCCYREPEVRKVVAPRQPTEKDHLLINDGRTVVDYREPTSQILALPSSSTRPPSNPTPPDVVLVMQDTGSGKPPVPVPSSVSRLVTRDDLLPSTASASLPLPLEVYPEWNDESFRFAETPCQKVWAVSETIFGDERRPIALSKGMEANWMRAPAKIKNSFTLEQQPRLETLFYKKVTHYCLPEVQEHVGIFLTKILDLWYAAPDRENFTFAYYPTESSYYFFAVHGERAMYIKLRRIKGRNDETTLSSQPATRGPSQGVSRAVSRHPSPKKAVDTKASTSSLQLDEDSQ